MSLSPCVLNRNVSVVFLASYIYVLLLLLSVLSRDVSHRLFKVGIVMLYLTHI